MHESKCKLPFEIKIENFVKLDQLSIQIIFLSQIAVACSVANCSAVIQPQNGPQLKTVKFNLPVCSITPVSANSKLQVDIAMVGSSADYSCEAKLLLK